MKLNALTDFDVFKFFYLASHSHMTPSKILSILNIVASHSSYLTGNRILVVFIRGFIRWTQGVYFEPSGALFERNSRSLLISFSLSTDLKWCDCYCLIVFVIWEFSISSMTSFITGDLIQFFSFNFCFLMFLKWWGLSFNGILLTKCLGEVDL